MSFATLDVSALDGIWQWPAKARRVSGSASGAPVDLSGRRASRSPWAGRMPTAQAVARERLDRLASGVSEVMVKVTGRKHIGGAAAAHFAYIGRHGELEVETRDGERIDEKDALVKLAAEWESDVDTDRGQRVVAVAMVFSMPAGTPPSVVKDAARAVADREFGRDHDYVTALHIDTDKPHVHLTIAATGEDGRRFDPKRQDLARIRESFARELRDRGVAAEATPRRARGRIRAGQTMPLYKQRQAYRAGNRPLPRADARIAAGVAAVVEGREAFAHTPTELRAARNWHIARRVYADAASRLAKSSDPHDRALAQKVDAFVTSFPEPNSYRMQIGKGFEQTALTRANEPIKPDRTRQR